MLPYITTCYGDISLFTVMAVLGIVAVILSVHFQLYRFRESEEAFIFPKIVISGSIGYIFSVLTDVLLKYIKYGIFKIYGMTFYGGLFGSCISLCIILKFCKKTKYSISEWFDIITPGFIIFHIFGRIGCFFSGCCYGKYSDGIFAITFPDNIRAGVIHNGKSCYPTQLYEALVLVLILVIVLRSVAKFKTYISCYAVARFLLEFLRGDDRGICLFGLYPSQIISIILLITMISLSIRHKLKASNCKLKDFTKKLLTRKKHCDIIQGE